jgi:hypothetical protein
MISSFEPYAQMKSSKSPLGAGSQFVCLSELGCVCWTKIVSDPSLFSLICLFLVPREKRLSWFGAKNGLRHTASSTRSR